MRVPLLVVCACAAPAVALAAAPDTPARKGGWWEMTMSMSAPMAMTRKMNTCVDPAADSGAFDTQQGRRPAECTQAPPRRTGAGWAFSSTCTSGGMTIATSGVASGDFQGHYRVEATTRMTPAPMPQMAETRTVIEGAWKGPCPAGRRPGQVW